MRAARHLLPLLMLLLAASEPAAQVEPIETYQFGPFAVGSADWHFGSVGVTEPGTGGQGVLEVEHFGTLRYPAVAEGEGQPVAPGGPFPFVVFAHGRFHQAPFIGSNHLQATYLIEHLASWGFIVASVNLDVVGQYGLPPAIVQRGQLIRSTIAAFKLQDPQGLAADFEHIGLVGHSRGGEGCLAAWNGNSEGHAIVAIATIAPTFYQPKTLTDVPYLGLYGSKDGDVNNGWPIFAYDEATGANKAFEYIEGANHFWFTDSINFNPENPALISREQHHDIARTYITAFLLATLREDVQPFPELSDDPSLFPVTDDAVIHPMYSDPGALVVNDFEDLPPDAGSNSLGGLSVGDLLLDQSEVDLDDPGATFYHLTRASRIRYLLPPLEAPWYAETLGGGLDVSGYGYVSLRALQKWNADLNPTGEPQDLRVALLDGRGNLAVRALSLYGTIPWPKTHSNAIFPKKSVLRTTRLPLADFQAVNPDIDLTDLRFLGLVFDRDESGDLRIDDLEFTD
jgi:dienelactone hydrolase